MNPSLPKPAYNLDYSTPATTWDEGFPLGNGLLGALLWGNGDPFRISLNRTDLWDCRSIPEFSTPAFTYAQLAKWRDQGDVESIRKVFDVPYGERAAPTKIPAGRLELTLPSKMSSGILSIAQALAKITFANGDALEAFVDATDSLGFLRYTGSKIPGVKILAPPFQGVPAPGVYDQSSNELPLTGLGYPAPHVFDTDMGMSYEQSCRDGFQFVIHIGWKITDGEWLACWTIATSRESAQPLDFARERVGTALRDGWQKHLSSHEAWWETYWKASSVSLPNPELERQWYLDQYKFGAASRRGAPPVTLQGPWTADNGKTPPWKGDYHHDLNTQMSYWSCYSANHLEEGLAFVDWLWETKDRCMAWTRHYFGCDGLNVPGVADLENNPLGGWAHYSLSATTGCWLAQYFYLHWRYSRDREFLANRAYPYLREAAIFADAITRPEGSGPRTLKLSASPEINDNQLDAWFPQITNHDLSLLRWVLAAAAELADELNLPDDAKRWREILPELPELAYGAKGELLVAPGYPLPYSHRHFSHLLAIHPLCTIRWDQGEEAQRCIRACLEELEARGTSLWIAFSFTWMASLYAIARDGENAERQLEIFRSAFTLRNSFNCNGDQSDKGYSDLHYRPFTLEANFSAAAATQEMLLQSAGGIIRVFPAVPAAWKDVAFTTLRAEGAFLVSAVRKDGATKSIEIKSEQGGPCRLECPFTGIVCEVKTAAGQTLRFDSQHPPADAVMQNK